MISKLFFTTEDAEDTEKNPISAHKMAVLCVLCVLCGDKELRRTTDLKSAD
jgi:hypothetical protein